MSETTLKIPHAVKIEESNCVSFKVGLHASYTAVNTTFCRMSVRSWCNFRRE